MATMMSHCMDLVLANEAGGYYGWDDHDQLAIFEVGEGGDGARYVNVDTTSLDGLKRAHDLGLARSGMADVIVAARFVPAVEQLFDERYRGRMFALLRHPVERAVSMYYYRQYATWEPTYEPCLSEMTVLEYARNPRFVEGNWMVRTLTDKMVGEVTREDLEAAKEILRRKCLVGIVDGSSEGGGRMAESVRRFDAYFGFSAGPGEKKVCTDNLLHDRGVHGEGRGSNKHSHPHYGPESPEWKALAKAHELDMELYQYAEGLFEVQGALLEEMDLST
uniref:Sulfotransferase domain-containing protein n=1 Tax=Trieres chinensis TaxID=1514140 RepID=A0A7S2E747_TRICV